MILSKQCVPFFSPRYRNNPGVIKMTKIYTNDGFTITIGNYSSVERDYLHARYSIIDKNE
jgi:hypothetical protein